MVTGNIWAQTWNHVEKFTRPYPDKPDVDVTEALISQVNALMNIIFNYVSLELLIIIQLNVF